MTTICKLCSYFYQKEHHQAINVESLFCSSMQIVRCDLTVNITKLLVRDFKVFKQCKICFLAYVLFIRQAASMLLFLFQ